MTPESSAPFGGYGSTRIRSAATPRNGQQSALAVGTTTLMDALGIADAVIGGFDWGARRACIIAALWPDRCGPWCRSAVT